MYNHTLKASASALLALVLICMVTSATEFNGSTYRLGQKEVVVALPVNDSKMNLTLSAKTDNMTLIDENGKEVGLNSSYRFWRGDHIYSLIYEKHIRGELIYSLPLQGQQFILPLKSPDPVRIILPPGYTTGNRALGIAMPPPDESMTNETGNVLTWFNTTGFSYIEIDYYRSNAPQALMMIMGILAAAGVILLVRYYISTKKLKDMKDEDF